MNPTEVVYVAGAATAAALFVYLLVALLKAEAL
ncbi:potassium-transporting ATPase subunit F [Pseudoduganella sp. SL102]|nr:MULTISPECIES: potassium-transporting ATPase subunit F [Pseudoduganella]QBH99741.1 potassium-transporting ATPase subunit F [Pseudoduganella albidiflava]WBS02265.1 potassium-transporting ATPase subunit F [Pseudoduganella sp. SL102]